MAPHKSLEGNPVPHSHASSNELGISGVSIFFYCKKDIRCVDSFCIDSCQPSLCSSDKNITP